MNKREFLLSVPEIIEHRAHGYCELKVVLETEQLKVICYKHADRTTSFRTEGNSWSDVALKLRKLLKDQGYLT